ncbi:MAG: hypothetical protein ACOC2F_07050, partial [Bacteroidota bacterium]
MKDVCSDSGVSGMVEERLYHDSRFLGAEYRIAPKACSTAGSGLNSACNSATQALRLYGTPLHAMRFGFDGNKNDYMGAKENDEQKF